MKTVPQYDPKRDGNKFEWILALVAAVRQSKQIPTAPPKPKLRRL